MIIVMCLFWMFFCVLVGMYAHSKGRSFGGFFVLAFLLSPIIGFLAAAAVMSRDERLAQGETFNGYKKCPFCAEAVRAEAIKCKHCGSKLPVTVTDGLPLP